MNFSSDDLPDIAIIPYEGQAVVDVNRNLSKILMVGRDGLKSRGDPINI